MIREERRLLYVFDDILNIVAQGRSKQEWNSVEELLYNISKVPQKQNLQLCDNYNEVTNTIRRCMKLVRESKLTKKSIDVDRSSLVNILMGSAREM